MDSVSTVPARAVAPLLEDFSLEMTGKDVPRLEEARATIPPGTRINVTFLGNEDLGMRLNAARAVKRFGFVPVPHISARRLRSRESLEEFLEALRAEGLADNVFVVGGDPATPEGPYDDSLAVIRSGLLQKYGVRHVGMSGYPEGHPAITDPVLWSAIETKAAVLGEQRLPGGVITQFGFDIDPVLTWVEAVRQRGIGLPVRIGVPGPAGVRRLMGYAARFGVGTSASIAKKYGLSLTNLMGTAGPDRFIRALAERYDVQRHGEVKLHFYTFGGLKATSEWVAGFRTKDLTPVPLPRHAGS
ncbi:5,10-methylenetetrahydrofolate reductase [Streptomyces avermitilis]|uniref:Methylenetetrahydrofolate reductase n=1 Tax=Streptomyces avermitilis TaxID=33903 RepID=A0A4D4MKC1_STRAX|nr:methylenetetrahydrofolate reductase [Streptomyces avermitilis]OOV18042.1 5,10-methylenetetrahydrofolate reductase [Streptomyces avermitilis]BBJ56039.1 methylenetetrahydrofolate reductase [Streptomyces avermitilis]GDY67983.1 methylenetetrahydrofolate reductase [Streptomyces avermitilis]GDY71687.1 methylenetetrahydrofolate reductase [Streptomyces avermitilis]GDY80872.1 methylenetetrahydrofolate reductase [Streptomyces avermitilis]